MLQLPMLSYHYYFHSEPPLFATLSFDHITSLHYKVVVYFEDERKYNERKALVFSSERGTREWRRLEL